MEAPDNLPIFSDPALDGLTDREKLFVINYCAWGTPTFCNAVRSAEAAGYQGNVGSTTFSSHASQILKRKHVQTAIAALMQNRVCSLQEVFVRLTDIIRGPAALVLEIKEEVHDKGRRTYQVEPALAAAVRNGHAHLIAGIKIHETTIADITTKSTEIKMPDPLAAMKAYLAVYTKLAAAIGPGANPLDQEQNGGDSPDGTGGKDTEFWVRLESRIHEEGRKN